jgi:hypothetical protein
MWGTPNGGRPERYGRTFGNAHSQLQGTNIRRSVVPSFRREAAANVPGQNHVKP